MLAFLAQGAEIIPQEWGTPLLIAMLTVVAGAFYRSQEARIKREQDLNDKLTATIPELVSGFREVKQVILDDRKRG